MKNNPQDAVFNFFELEEEQAIALVANKYIPNSSFNLLEIPYNFRNPKQEAVLQTS